MIFGRPKSPLLGQNPRDLPEWLEMATLTLVPSAQARIRSEIEAHYADAVQSHLSSGSPESTAHATALADLGDPSAAAARFRREHLTVKEAQAVARRTSPKGVFSFQSLAL